MQRSLIDDGCAGPHWSHDLRNQKPMFETLKAEGFTHFAFVDADTPAGVPRAARLD